jgi:hypothetical protein
MTHCSTASLALFTVCQTRSKFVTSLSRRLLLNKVHGEMQLRNALMYLGFVRKTIKCLNCRFVQCWRSAGLEPY